MTLNTIISPLFTGIHSILFTKSHPDADPKDDIGVQLRGSNNEVLFLKLAIFAVNDPVGV